MKTNRKYRLSMFIVSASLLLASCSLDDVFDKHSDSANSAGGVTTDGSIAFNPVSPATTKSGNGDGWQTVNVPLGSSDKASKQATTAVATRGAYVSGTGAPAGSFGVLGYLIKSGGNISSVAPSSFMYNTQVTRNGVSGSYTYTYNPKKYWPDNTSDMVRFFAYYPYNGDGITLPAATDTGFPVLTYSPSTTVANQVDLMHVAAPAAVNNKIVGTAVGLNFSHALTRVSFSVKKDVSLASNAVVVKSIRLSGIKSKGYLPLGFSWSLSTVATDTTSYTSSVTDGTLIPTASQSLNTSTYQLLNSYNGYQLLLPQDVTSANKIYVTYILDGVTKSAEYNLPAATWSIGQSVNLQFTLPTLLGTGTNCYILNPSVSTSRAFFLPVSRVNEYWGTTGIGNNSSYTIGASDTWKMVLIWEDAANMVTLSNLTGTGLSTLPVVSIPANASGNAVVGVMKTSGSGVLNTILWSWHLWVTDYNPSNTTTSYGGLIWMDRNLGATSNSGIASIGLYYQWGRKDPFPAAKDFSGTEPYIYHQYWPNETSLTGGAFTPANVLNNPTVSTLPSTIQYPWKYYTYSSSSTTTDWYSSGTSQDDDLWGGVSNTKKIYDPCPSGWRVPFNGSWSFLYEGNFIYSSTNQGFIFTYSPSFFYPAAGLRYFNGGLGNVSAIGQCWSATAYENGAYSLIFFCYATYRVIPSSYEARSIGLSVRCVKQ
jgi:hypothetical protein